MTREEAARILDPETMWDTYNEITYYGGFNGKKIWLESANEAGRMGAAALRELDAQEKLKPMNEWISVKDRLPEVPEGYERIQVIVRCCYGVDTAWVQRDTKKFYDIAGWLRSEVIGVTHWMPLPCPPKEDDHD